MDYGLSLCTDFISKLDLDLSGYQIVTEVGSAHYLYFPIIAALAGGKRVIAVAKDTNYGTASNTIKSCKLLLQKLDLDSKVEFVLDACPEEILETTDILINAGNLRPINRSLLEKLPKHAVVPLMYEKWEFRPEDIDLEAAIDIGIKVAGTFEAHPDIEVFSYVGALGLKMLQESGEKKRSPNTFIWSEDNFGLELERAFTESSPSLSGKSCDRFELEQQWENLDVLFLSSYNSNVNFTELLEAMAAASVHRPRIVHLYGELDYLKTEELGYAVHPRKNGISNVMTFTLGNVGLQPIIALQAAGYKVGQCLLEGKSSELVQPMVNC